MPKERLSMRKIRDVLRYRHSTGLSLEAIARALNLSKGVVAKYLRLATLAGLGWPLPEDLDDTLLEKRLYQQPSARVATFAEPDYAQIHQELKRKGVTLILLWEEYQASQGDRAFQYTAFCTHYNAWAGKLKRSMRQTHRAGEKLFADYAGPTMPIIDPDSGEIGQASIFVAVLGASSYTFACASAAQKQADWLSGLARALTFIGGVPQIIVPDYVAGNIIQLMFPPPLCGRRRVMPRVVSGGLRGSGNIIGYRAFSQSSSGLSSFQAALLRPPAETAQAGSHARNAAALARSVNSAYRLVVSKLT